MIFENSRAVCKSFRKSRTFLSDRSPSTPTLMNTPTSASAIGEEILHFNHPQHPLVEASFPYIFTCIGCKEYGAGKRFRCRTCDLDFHDFCVLAPPSLQRHPFHSHHQLVFHTKPGEFLCCVSSDFLFSKKNNILLLTGCLILNGVYFLVNIINGRQWVLEVKMRCLC